MSCRLLYTVLFVALSCLSFEVYGEALSTTSIGIGMRQMNYTSAKSDTATADKEAEAVDESFDDPMLCERISTPSSLGIEIGAGGCIQTGGVWAFVHTVSSHVHLIYYPLASRSRIDNDSAVSIQRKLLGDFYLLGMAGFAKITHGEIAESNASYTMDVLEFGGGAGWSYRAFEYVSLGIEGSYLIGSIMSSSSTGTTSLMTAAATITVFL